MMAEDTTDTLILTAEIVASYLGGESHRVTPEQIPELIRSVRAALKEAPAAANTASANNDASKPSKRDITKSITPDALISFVDGKPYKTLKRHLTRHGMSMGDYRARYGLPSDYPSTAPNYSATRSAMAKSLGLGAKRKSQTPAPPAPKGRAKKAAAE